jgi:ribonuclease E
MNKKRMLINAIDREEKRMAIVAEAKLSEFNIQMSAKEPISGNIYKGIVMKVERGLQAAFVDYGSKKNGFLPLHDVHSDYFERREEAEGSHKHKRTGLKIGQNVLVQVQREEKDRKGAMLTTFISLPGRYLVLMPNRQSVGVSRKIEDETDRKRLKDLIDQINKDDTMGLIIRTAGMSRKKQELARDYQQLLRLWETINECAESTKAPALIYQESDFGVKSLRDYLNPDIHEILVDDADTLKKMRDYMKTVAPRSVNMIKLYKEKVPLFDKFKLEEQINEVYQERVNLKSGGYIIISPTEAMITIDVNSGRASNKKDVEETAFRANLEAAEEIARQLRLRDLGGLIVIDFIDMKDKRHNSELEKAFKKALSFDRARIQLSKISKFGIIELSRQKKQSTIQEISFKQCAHCKGSGLIPSVEYTALGLFRKIKSEIVKGNYLSIKVTTCTEVSEYLLNQKRTEISALEEAHDTSVFICSDSDLHLGESTFEFTKREDREVAPAPKPQKKKGAAARAELPAEAAPEAEEEEAAEVVKEEVQAEAAATPEEPVRKKSRRRTRRRRRKGPKPAEAPGMEEAAEGDPELGIDAGVEAQTIPEPAVAAPPEQPPVQEKKEEKQAEAAGQEAELLPLAEPPKPVEPGKKKKAEKPELPSVISKIYDLFS